MPRIQANGIELYYESQGDGPPLLLIMGLGCSARQWDWMREILAAAFHVITFDNRGVGRSDKPDHEYTSELLADDAVALLDALEVERAHVMGASMGGMVAQQVALRHPHRVHKLVLGCTMPAFGFVAPTDETIGLMAAAGSAEVPPEVSAAGMVDIFLSPHFRERDPATTDALRRMMEAEKREQGPDAFMHQFSAMASHDATADLERISSPTLVMIGDGDIVVPPPNAEHLAKVIPDAQYSLLEGVWHAFWVEAPGESSERVRAFLLD